MIELSEVLEKYDRIFLFMEKDKNYGDFAMCFCLSSVLECSVKNVLILSTEQLVDGKMHVCRRLSWEEAVRLKELYLLYEFSDRFKLFSWEDSFGSIANYIESGVLTWEEAFAAILH